MKVEVSRTSNGYAFLVEMTQSFETVDDVIKACLQLEAELVTKEIEEDEMEDE